jgi:hypothetical protein
MVAKIGLAVIGGIIAVACAAWLWLDHSLSGLCGNTVIEEVASPSGSMKAVLFERSCGATTGFSSQLSVVDADASLRNVGGNTFVAEGYPEGYSLRWLDDSTLEVAGVKGQVFKRESRVLGVEIRYQ